MIQTTLVKINQSKDNPKRIPVSRCTSLHFASESVDVESGGVFVKTMLYIFLQSGPAATMAMTGAKTMPGWYPNCMVLADGGTISFNNPQDFLIEEVSIYNVNGLNRVGNLTIVSEA